MLDLLQPGHILLHLSDIVASFCLTHPYARAITAILLYKTKRRSSDNS
ncbi:hypothetical protein B4168_3743 [Anoxybacillus flavithermus]|nr:hypothetical protein B4168_3743 [Anoxybacillus flavithermus]